MLCSSECILGYAKSLLRFIADIVMFYQASLAMLKMTSWSRSGELQGRRLTLAPTSRELNDLIQNNDLSSLPDKSKVF